METTASAVPDQMTLALVNTYVVRKAAKLNMFAGSCAQTLLQVQSSLHEARVHLQLLECELAAAAAAAASAAGSADAIDLTTPSRCAVVMPSPRNAPAVSPKRTCQRSPTRRSLSTSEDDTKSCRSGSKFLDAKYHEPDGEVAPMVRSASQHSSTANSEVLPALHL